MKQTKTREKSILMIVCMVLVLMSAFLLSACGAKNPIEKSDAVKAFTLDLGGEKVKTLSISDYIDEAGAKGVTYKTRSGKASAVSVTQPDENGAFQVTGVAVTTAVTVYITASQNGETALEVDIAVTVVDSTPRYYVTGMEDGFGYKLAAPDNVVQGESYSFVIERLYGFKGTPSFAYTINGQAGAALTPVEEPLGTFTYTVAGDVMGEFAFVKNAEAESIISGFSYDTFEDAYPLLPTNFFEIANWAGGSGDAPTLEDGVLKFENSFRRFNVTNAPSELILNTDGAWPNEDKSDVGPYTFSFSLKTEGSFLFAFMSSGASTPNELRLSYDGNGFSLGRSVGGGNATFGTALNTETGFENGKEFRFDIIVSATYQKVTNDGLAEVLEADPQNGLLKVTIYLDGEKMIFKSNGNAELNNTSTSAHNFRLDNGDTYIQRLNLPGAAARYNKYVAFSTVGEDDGVVSISPAPILGDRYEVTGATRTEPGYTMRGIAAARGGMAYTLTLERNSAYTGTPVIETTIGGTAYTLPAPVVTENTMIYTIPGADITGDIVFGTVTGIVENIFDVTLPDEAVGYVITGAEDIATKGIDYTFTLTVWTGYTVGADFKVNYTVGGGAAQAATVSAASPYTVTIPGANISGEIKITVAGITQTPATYHVTGIVSNAGYTMAGDASVAVPDAGAYVMTVTVAAGYAVYGDLTLPVTIDGKVITLTGIETAAGSGIYTLEIAKDRIITNVTVGTLSGVVEVTDVTGIMNGVGYTMQGGDKAYFGTNYVFTVFVNNPATILIPTYQVGGAAAKPAELVRSGADGRNYVFMIPSADFVSGEAIAIATSFADGSGISVKPAATSFAVGSLTKTGEFHFSDFIDAGGATIAYEIENISGGDLTLASTADTFTLTADNDLGIGQSVTVRIWVLKDGKRIFKADVAIGMVFETEQALASGANNTDKNQDNLLSANNKAFDVSAWEGVSGGRNTAPAMQADGSLKFSNTTQRVLGAIFNAGDAADLTAETVASYTYSFLFFSEDDQFNLRFFASGGETEQLTVREDGTANPNVSGNSYSLTYSEGRFAYYATLGGGTAYTTPYYFTPAVYEEGKWNRFDFVFTTVMDDLTGGGNDAYTAAWGTIETRVYINGIFQEMENAAGEKTAEKTTPSINRVSKITDGVPSFMRCGSNGVKNYGSYLMIQTKLDGSISIAPVSGWKQTTTAPGYDGGETVAIESAPFGGTDAGAFAGSYDGAQDGSDLDANITIGYQYGSLAEDAVYTYAFKVTQLSGTVTQNIQMFAHGSDGLYWDVLNNISAIPEQESSDEMLYFASRANAAGYCGYFGNVEGEIKTASAPLENGYQFIADQAGSYLVTCSVVELSETGYTVRGNYQILVVVE